MCEQIAFAHKDHLHLLDVCHMAYLKGNQSSCIASEMTAPELLKLLGISCSLVNIDAMGCQKKITEAILGKETDYLLAVKGNQEKPTDTPSIVFTETDQYAHGRGEHRPAG